MFINRLQAEEEELEKLEELAASLSLQIYCRDLFRMARNQFDLFIKYFAKQDLPYSHYVSDDGEVRPNSYFSDFC